MFAKDPLSFIQRCHENLLDGGNLFVDWSMGQINPFKFKVGWRKDGEHEFMFENNLLWSSIWDDSFLENKQCKIFCSQIKKMGYNNLKQAVYEEVPKVLEYHNIKKYFDCTYEILTTTKPSLHMYVLIKGTKRSA
jgi:hypothetical protein